MLFMYIEIKDNDTNANQCKPVQTKATNANQCNQCWAGGRNQCRAGGRNHCRTGGRIQCRAGTLHIYRRLLSNGCYRHTTTIQTSNYHTDTPLPYRQTTTIQTPNY